MEMGILDTTLIIVLLEPSISISKILADPSVGSFKRRLSQLDNIPRLRQTQIIHAQLCNNCSSLCGDLFDNYISDNPKSTV
jgi:hypothetical protein